MFFSDIRTAKNSSRRNGPGVSMLYDYESLLEQLNDGVYFVDTERRITFWNRAAEQITGRLAAEVLGRCCHDDLLKHVDEQGNRLCHGACPLVHAMADAQPREVEIYLHHKNGHRVPVHVRTMPLRDAVGNIVGGAEIFHDLSAHQATRLRMQELEELALLDPLTRLSNRKHLEMELDGRLQEMQRYALSFGLIFFDIDDFKQVNDTHGHDIGDRVLQALAGTVLANARPFDLFGRWGGEEFVGILRNLEGGSIGRVAERFRALIEKSHIALDDGGTLSVSVSIGATMARRSDTSHTLLKRVDQLMYASKKAGKNRVTTDQ